MKIGIPTEIKDNEFRVGIVPAGVEELVRNGHDVLIQAEAGAGSGISDEEFMDAGADILPDAALIWSGSDLVMKVKEPLPAEYGLMKKGQVLFAFLHLAPIPDLVDALLEHRIRAIAFETIMAGDGSLPLLAPMSQVAGKMAVQVGATYLQKEKGGIGRLLGGVPGTGHGRVVIIGGGNVGISAAKVACGLGAEVVILDTDHRRLTYIDDVFNGKVETLMSNSRSIREAAASCDVLVGGALLPGALAPKLITRDVLKGMRPGSVFVDVSIDQGGMGETSRATSHSDPVYIEENVIHYCVPNIPGSVPATSTTALANVTLPYCLRLASDPEEALRSDPGLALGANTWDGHITCKPVAEALGREWKEVEELI